MIPMAQGKAQGQRGSMAMRSQLDEPGSGARAPGPDSVRKPKEAHAARPQRRGRDGRMGYIMLRAPRKVKIRALTQKL